VQGMREVISSGSMSGSESSGATVGEAHDKDMRYI
jgi:hypothetical protein